MRTAATAILLLVPCLAQKLPTVALLSTGGTIASRQDAAKGGYLPSLTGQDLVTAIPGLQKVAHIQIEEISNISSSDMTPDLWLRIAAKVNELAAKPEIAGIVITHGTNTLEETAYFLDLTSATTKPVILVGAQRPASDSDSDGPRNLLNAVRVAVDPEATGKGAMIVMNGQITAARDVTKTNTSQVETFRSLEFGALGVVDVEKVSFYRAPLRRQTFALEPQTKLPRIEIILTYAGSDGLLIRSLVRDGGVQGLVIAGLGLGNVPAAMVEAIEEARKRNIAIVISSRVPTGRVFPLGASKGSALDLRKMGCVLADNLTPQKARVLLMLGLTRTHETSGLQKYFDN